MEKAWPFGICEFGSVTQAGAAYVAGYVRKKISAKVNPDAYLRVQEDTGELVELEREFARMSLRPAIGLSWIQSYWRDVYPRDFVIMNGSEMKPPRYYDKWMQLEDEKGGAQERRQMMMEVREKRYEEMPEDLSGYTLKAKEKIHLARLSLYGGRGQC